MRVRVRDKIHDNLTGKAYKAWWYDPRKGTSTLIGQFPRTEPGDRPADVRRSDISREFTPPSSGPGNDWVLVLDDVDKNFPPPGAKPSGRACFRLAQKRGFQCLSRIGESF